MVSMPAAGTHCAAELAVRQVATPALTDDQLLTEIQRRAFLFFWEKADPITGLVNDRARNNDKDNYTVASIASTGYALAALPIGVEHGWITRAQAVRRAGLTLRFLDDRMPHVHGWYYHFIDKHTAARIWRCELSSMDTGLLIAGALTCGQYFPGTKVQQLAETLYDRLDWDWMRTNGGKRPDKRLLSHGWTPERGFLKNDWETYNEAAMLYLLGLGARKNGLPAACWGAWTRNRFEYSGMETLIGGPLFVHEMAHGFYDFKDRRDRQGYDYWISSLNAVRINRQLCLDLARKRKTYGPDIWGLNASDGPKGYRAYGVPKPEDGTVSPTGAIASITFMPEQAVAAAHTLYTKYGEPLWGRYGFGNAFNVDADWFDPDVIGIDLGMALLAIENHRSGLIPRLLASHPSTKRAYAAAGLHPTREQAPRPLQMSPVVR